MPIQTPPALPAVLKVANNSIARKIAVAETTQTQKNYTVLSVTPKKGGLNTEVRISVDTTVYTDSPVRSDDRFARRNVSIDRIDLAAIAEFRELEKENGCYLVDYTSKATIIAALNANISEAEVELIELDATTKILRAKRDSLGYIGQVTVKHQTPDPVPVQPTQTIDITSTQAITTDANGDAIEQLVFALTPTTPAASNVAWTVTGSPAVTISQTGELTVDNLPATTSVQVTVTANGLTDNAVIQIIRPV